MPLVSTAVGSFLGTNDTLVSFLGIKYATSQRFQYPQPHYESKNTTIKAQKFQSACPQICRDLPSFCPNDISEDCLFLNIWTPFKNDSQLLIDLVPVVVFIHGGSFEMGSGSINVLDGEYLARELNAIVVTFNYRLSIFGFPGWDLLPPNIGIRDQQLALKWVYDNIGNFGGNVESMTLAGQSAGALSALLHLSTFPQNQWFKNGIIMSPPGISFRQKSKAMMEMQRLGDSLGCGLNLECFQGVGMRELLNANHDLKQQRDLLSISAELMPVIGGMDIADHPLSCIDDIPININLMIGLVSNETSYSINNFVPIDFGQDTLSLVFKGMFGSKIATQVIQSDLGYSGKNGLINAMTDTMFACPNLKIYNRSGPKMYGYYWEAMWSGTSRDSQGNICGEYACHSIDVAYMFNEPTNKDEKLVGNRFRSFVKEFIRGGKPIGEVEWPQVDANGKGIVSFSKNSDLTINDVHPRFAQCQYWNQNFDFLNPTFTVQSTTNISFLIIVPLILFLLLIINIQNWLFLYTNYLRVQFKGPSTRVEVAGDEKLKLLTASMGLSPLPVEIMVNELSFNRNGRNLLLNCSAKFSPGTMTAVLGPSGSGKTTLLSLISGQIIDKHAQRAIKFNQISTNMLNPRIIKDTVAFVAQYDLPYDGLTPREVLLYHSMLNSVKNDYSAISKHVDFILMLLGLENVANIVLQTTCAKTQGGLSGGQKRRLSVALAMIKRPSIIILDEPTSGLDCKSSFEIIKNLKVLSEHGYNIIAIIHQPRQEVFDLFTHCTVVSSGSVVFNGKRTDCYDYFVDINKQQGFSQEKVYNTCDYIGDSVSRLERVLPVFKQKESSLNESVAKKYGNLTTTTSISTWAQIAVTNARYWNTRPLTRKLSMLLIAFLTSLALGMLQHRSGNDIISISLAIKGIIIACLGLGALKNINLSFDYYDNRDIFDFDCANGNVSGLAFYIHRIVLEISTCTLEASVSGIITYLLLESRPLQTVGSIVILLTVIYYNCISSIFVLIYSTKLDRANARSISFIVQAVLCITSGLWIHKGDTFTYDLFAWIQYINPNYWVIPPLITSLLSRTGQCVMEMDGVCRLYLGDIAIVKGGIATIDPNQAIMVLMIITIVCRLLQGLLLYRDLHYPNIVFTNRGT